MTESERLREIRKVLGLTQKELSDALSIKQGSYSDVERGKAGISAVLLKNLIRKFRINPLWLCEGEGSMFIDVSNSNGGRRSGRSSLKKTQEFTFPADNEDLTKETEFQIDLAERQQLHIDNLISIVDFLKK